MPRKKSFKIYYLLLTEGTTEFNLFGYLTTKKFKGEFEDSDVQFSIKVEIVDAGISQGKLNGVGDLASFKSKYDAIKNDGRYVGQKLFFVIDKDFDDSSQVKKLIEKDENIVQFVEYNSEHLLLRFGGKNPKSPTDFSNMGEFRDYCKSEFQTQFNKVASDFKDADFDSIFVNTTDDEIKKAFVELFSTLS
ncbi:hypothetical protein IT397_01885 [Candidatus Nomurabacteria bacterium]|nr:hypothetical protein [Candidatus Nomurabacteria bacterium]